MDKLDAFNSAVSLVIPVDELMGSKILYSSTRASLHIVEVVDIRHSLCLGISPLERRLIIEPLPPRVQDCSAVFSNPTSQTADWMVPLVRASDAE